MLDSDVPLRMGVAFGLSAGASYIRQVPDDSQIGIEDGAASFATGFPPVCFLPLDAGGVPPFGTDVNGLLRQITQWCQWFAAGGPVAYDAAFAAAVGGYPKGAIVISTVTPGLFFLNTADNNTVDPDSDPENWQAFRIGSTGAAAGQYRRPLMTVGADGLITEIADGAKPTMQVFAAAGSFTYTPTAGAQRIWIRGVGAGGGRTGNGGNTIFNSIVANGGLQSNGAVGGGAGGAGGTGNATMRIPGAAGGRGIIVSQSGPIIAVNIPGGVGGGTPFGGGGSSDGSGPAGSGAGAGGSSDSGSGNETSSGGGGAGEYYEILLNALAANYPITIGAGGAGGGADGRLVIMEFYD